ncbi:MAG: CHC2 zinc finger domain-containing protein [Paracoccaceae bacterium]
MPVDFQRLKSRMTIEQAVSLLDLDLKPKGDQMRGACPVCEGSNERALVVTPKKGVFYCFHAQKGGDLIELASHIKGVPVKEAAEWLAGDTAPPKKARNESRQDSRGADQPTGFRELDYLVHDHPAVEAVGFAPEDAQRIGAGFAPRGVLRGTVAVPVRSQDGKLLGYLGVTEAIVPKSWHF